ncbi:helix-turn-helix domain-containing protein [Acidaminobacter sp. JC074]|uniref:helix-turn-helix domain-containing protein n=1 Tax=Acidaminobacter sp. JC074 TaxID=2530199 RepID=UPI001F111151|nr:helix-turn-helix domain-containing protein [Acidaminobacter sp. JC074]MCH4889459.1 helix-turn-helix domain-containing protein [Acidaminobacter sp. JC074]
MDSKKTGELIYKLRKEKHLTQAALADKIGISDKTVSKWERGLGCPDVSLLTDLSRVLEVDLNKLLLGELRPNKYNIGNMKLLDFYVCKTCNNIMFGLNDAEIYCCGRKLDRLVDRALNEEHKLEVSVIEDDYFIEMNHPMNKDHYINFIAYLVDGGITILKLYPEQDVSIRIPRYYKMDVYIHCNKDGLFRCHLK